jgi:aerobic-type carbon monoxide dehydrogenase small subunit (CoxS/CutS family)
MSCNTPSSSRVAPVRHLHAGMLMAARAYLDAGGGPDEDAIRESIAGNLCRCTGYTKIVDAIALVASGGVAQ